MQWNAQLTTYFRHNVENIYILFSGLCTTAVLIQVEGMLPFASSATCPLVVTWLIAQFR
jgi:hypothetical protein